MLSDILLGSQDLHILQSLYEYMRVNNNILVNTEILDIFKRPGSLS